MIDIKKGQPYPLLIFLLGIFMIGLTITILMKPMKVVYDFNVNDTALQEDIYQNFFERSYTSWIWAPFIIAIGLIIWVLIKMNQEGYG